MKADVMDPAASGRGAADVSPAGETLTVARVEAAGRADWDAYVSGAASAELYHDYRWRSLIADVFRHDGLYLMARDAGGRPRGVLPLVRLRSRLFGHFLVSMPYVNYGGLLVDHSAAADSLLAEAARAGRDLGAAHVELRHRSERVLDWRAREDKVSLVLELPDSLQALWDGFKAKLRSQIRRPQKDGAVVRTGGLELLNDFYCVFARNMRDLGTPVYPKRFFEAVLATFPDEARVHVVDLDGAPVAAGLVLAHRETLEIPWASSLREAARSSVNMLLYWSVLEEAVTRGFRRFDFGRSMKESGTYRFKRQWGAEPQQLRWHYWLREHGALPALTPSNPKYARAVALWRRLPMPLANMLGPRIVKNLPG